MDGWHHRRNGHECEPTSGASDGQGILVCCSPQGCKELDKTELLNWIELKTLLYGILLCFLFISWGTFEFFHILATVNNTTMNIHTKVTMWTNALISLRYRPWSRIAWSCINPLLKLLRNCQPILSKCLHHFYSQKLHMKVPISLLFHQHSLLPIFLL